VNSWSPLFHC